MVAKKIPQLESFSSEEKLILVGELWDQLAAHPESFPKAMSTFNFSKRDSLTSATIPTT